MAKKLNLSAPGASSWRAIFRRYRYSADSRGLQFFLTEEDVKYLGSRDCHYCGAPPKKYNAYANSKGKRFFYGEYRSASKAKFDVSWIYTNGIDRVDNTKGYYRGNCVSCCEMCNRMKLDYSAEIFLKQLLKILEHLKLIEI
jgi:hypothetical protein